MNLNKDLVYSYSNSLETSLTPLEVIRNMSTLLVYGPSRNFRSSPRILEAVEEKGMWEGEWESGQGFGADRTD